MAKEMISPKHKRFADEYIKHGDATKAYRAAYPKVKEETARVNSYKALQNTTVQDYIKERSDKITEIANQKLAETQFKDLLTTAEKRFILRQIARGELLEEYNQVLKGELKKVKRLPNLIERIKAIELENRMTGDHNEKSEASIIDKDGNVVFDIIFGNKI